MTTATQEQINYLAKFAQFQPGLDPAQTWLKPAREAAIAAFDRLGFPTLRDEDWQFTNVAAIAGTDFHLAPPPRSLPSPQSLRAFEFAGLDAHLLVFIDGHFAPSLSNLAAVPKGVRVTGLAEALRTDRALIEPHLARHAPIEDQAFTALNTAFMRDGLFVHVPRGVALEKPVHALFVSTPNPRPVATHPRHLILIGDAAHATIIEDYVSLDDSVTFSNVVTEIVGGADSNVHHYMIERESAKASNVSLLRAHQQRGCNLTSHTLIMGGGLVRNNVNPVLDGPGAECLVNGLYVTTGTQHVDNHMRIEHRADHCDSRQFYKGILEDQSHAVFAGRIIVSPGAQKTDAKQTNMNLLLSDQATIDTKPQLEIYADDVKCTHGATIGQMDAEALFYLRSRGLSEDTARSLLVFAFAGESLQRMKLDPIRRGLESMLMDRLPNSGVLRAIL